MSKQYIQARKRARVLKVENHGAQPRVVYTHPIPLEARGGVRKHDHFYPFEEMKVGGSFWVQSEKGSRGCTAGAITKFAKKSGWKFLSRGQLEDGKPNSQAGSKRGVRGTRIWRIA